MDPLADHANGGFSISQLASMQPSNALDFRTACVALAALGVFASMGCVFRIVLDSLRASTVDGTSKSW